jgi:hypothetical protein
MPVDRARRVVATGSWIAAVFIVGAAPLLWQAAQLVHAANTSHRRTNGEALLAVWTSSRRCSGPP